MKKAFHGSLVALLSSVGFAIAQPAEKHEPPVNPVLCPYGAPDFGYHGVPADHPADLLHGNACPGCAGGNFPEDFVWLEAEYLVWRIKNGPLAAPLVTVGSTADPVPGALNQPNTFVLVGDHGIDYKTFSGARWTAGFWATCDHIIGFEASGFLLETRPEQFLNHSDQVGRPLIAQPFFNELTQAEDARAITVPGLFSGGIAINSTSHLWGVEGNVRSCVVRDCSRGFDILAGFRYADLGESLTIDAQSTSLSANSTFLFNNTTFQGPGNQFTSFDSFSTHNRFYGGQVGAQADYRWNHVFVNVLGKIALGDNHETVTVNGFSSVTTTGGVGPVLPSGLFAASSNSGVAEHNQFVVVPELRVRLGYEFNHYVSAYVGYTLFYWSDVVRPGEQIDHVLNPTLISTDPLFGQALGTSRPSPRFERSDFWAQGVDFGLAFTY